MSKRFLPSLSLGLMTALLVVLWFAGGASRADTVGQVITRIGASAIAIAFVLFAAPPRWRPILPVAVFMIAAISLPALQLIPLPASWWSELPGRQIFLEAAAATGQEQPWRPLSISPSATANALYSLIVPLITLLLAAGLSYAEHWRLVTLVLAIVMASCLIGLLQFSGTPFDHPMLNDTAGAVSGSFANRNHFALFAAIGCLLAPVWAFQERGGARWKGPVALAIVFLFALIILATGSRMGMLVGALGIAMGMLIVRRRITGELNRLPRWLTITLLSTTGVVVVVTLLLSVTLDRAVSLNRTLSLGFGEDLRSKALPAVLEMVRMYFPVGTGFGTFDPIFRISEPKSLLDISYFNHAHNDFVEIVLDGGLPGLLLLCGAMVWWILKSIYAVRSTEGSQKLLRLLGSSILLLVLLASVTDYPARTPIIMSLIVIAAVWLNGVPGSTGAADKSPRRG